MENDIIENFGDLPKEERARLMDQEQINLLASIERATQDNERKAKQVEQLRQLAQGRRALLEQMRALAAEDERIEHEVERVLAQTP